MSARGDFWARRKAGVAAEAEAEAAARAAQSIKEEQAAFDGMDEAEVLQALDLPDPDSLTKGDDFSVFMAHAVPDQIRRRALRALWRTNPVLANVDMLVDYGEDFTDAALAVENIQTAYQVGKGMLKHIEDMARQAEERADPQLEDEPEDTIEDAAEPDLAAALEAPPEPARPDPAQDDPPLARTTPRRMTFRIEERA